jgi:hypothetical protein
VASLLPKEDQEKTDQDTDLTEPTDKHPLHEVDLQVGDLSA